MALTPEDVVNKRFQPTKFREGYDQDEVDDFLDEIVVELRRLTKENDELKRRLAASDARVSELQSGAGAAPAAAAPETPASGAVPVPTPAAAPQGAEPEGEDDAAGTNNLLQLARRLHDEHVAEGKQKREQLIAEGEAKAQKLVADAEAKHRTELESLEKQRTELEKRIDELRSFERDYRQTLRSYIQGQLQELEAGGDSVAKDATASAAPSSPVSAATASSGAGTSTPAQPAQGGGTSSSPGAQPASQSAPRISDLGG